MPLILEESLSDRICTEGLRDTLIRPILISMLFWGGVFFLFERIGAARYGFSGKVLVFAIIMSISVGILSVLARVSWGRELEITEQGRILLRGRRKFVVAAANLADIPTPLVSEQKQAGIITIELRFPTRMDEKRVIFTTRCSEDNKAEFIELFHKRAS